MKILLVFGIILLMIWCVLMSLYKVETPKGFLDKKHSDIVRGYAILFVLFGHVGQQSEVNGIELPAGIGVSLFLILSGYGIALSIKKNGFENFWVKRLKRIWIPYIICQVGFWIFTKKQIEIKDILLDILFIRPRHTFGWYLRYITVCYVLIYIVWKIFTKTRQRFIMLGIAFFIWFIIRSTIFIDPVPFLQARQMLAFPLGIVLAYMPKDSQKYNNVLTAFICLVGGIGIYIFLHIGVIHVEWYLLYNAISLFTCVLCAFGIIVLIYHLKILYNCGMAVVSLVSYEIYLIHGYTIGVLGKHSYIALAWFIVLTVALSLLLHFLLWFCTRYIYKGDISTR